MQGAAGSADIPGRNWASGRHHTWLGQRLHYAIDAIDFARFAHIVQTRGATIPGVSSEGSGPSLILRTGLLVRTRGFNRLRTMRRLAQRWPNSPWGAQQGLPWGRFLDRLRKWKEAA